MKARYLTSTLNGRRFRKSLLSILRNKKVKRYKRRNAHAEQYQLLQYKQSRSENARVSFIEYLNQQLILTGGVKLSASPAQANLNRYKLLLQRAFVGSILESVALSNELTNDKTLPLAYYGYLMGQLRVRLFAEKLLEPWLEQLSEEVLQANKVSILGNKQRSHLFDHEATLSELFLHHSFVENDPLSLTSETFLNRGANEKLDQLLGTLVINAHGPEELFALERRYSMRRLHPTLGSLEKNAPNDQKLDAGKSADLFSANLNEWYLILQSQHESKLFLTRDKKEFRELSSSLTNAFFNQNADKMKRIESMLSNYQLYYNYNVKTDLWEFSPDIQTNSPKGISLLVPFFDATLGTNSIPEWKRSSKYPRHNKLKYVRLYDMRAASKFLLAEAFQLPPINGDQYSHVNNINTIFEYSTDFEEDFEITDSKIGGGLARFDKRRRVRYKSRLWGASRGGLREMYEQSLLVGIYNAGQVNDSAFHIFLQNQNVFTPVELYGTFCENTLGHNPTLWFKFYDQVENVIKDPLPHSKFIFKDTTLLVRNQGYYRPDMTISPLHTEFSLYDNIENIITGFTEMESRVGLEYAVTFYWYNYFYS
jgi:uncharacterized protein YaaR (DUF327 family)